MGLFGFGVIIKGIKTGLIVIISIILIIKLKKSKDGRIKDSYLSFILLGLWNLAFNGFDLYTILSIGSFVIPTSNLYFIWNIIRFAFVGIQFLILVLIFFRMWLLKQNRNILIFIRTSKEDDFHEYRYDASNRSKFINLFMKP